MKSGSAEYKNSTILNQAVSHDDYEEEFDDKRLSLVREDKKQPMPTVINTIETKDTTSSNKQGDECDSDLRFAPQERQCCDPCCQLF